MQINQLRSFPSEIRVPEGYEKIKNYPANSVSKFSHYSSSIILLELLLEVALTSFETFQPCDMLTHWQHALVERMVVRRRQSDCLGLFRGRLSGTRNLMGPCGPGEHQSN